MGDVDEAKLLFSTPDESSVDALDLDPHGNPNLSSSLLSDGLYTP
jgi:hypothetical protein